MSRPDEATRPSLNSTVEHPAGPASRHSHGSQLVRLQAAIG